ncbi:MAG: hypothetical protein WBY94_11425 [Polyangiaceae bacterium]
MRTAMLAGGIATSLPGCGTEVFLGGPTSEAGPFIPNDLDAQGLPDAGQNASIRGPSSQSADEAGADADVGGGSGAANDADGGFPPKGGGVTTTGANAGGEGGVVAPLTVQACNLVTATVCARGAQCITGADEANCESQLNREFDCDLANGEDFSPCLQDAQSSTCGTLLPGGGLTVPQSCLPPITATPLSDAQSQCYALVDALCAQSIQCLGGAPSSGDVQNCEDDFTTDLQDGLPCLLATAVGQGYAQCLAAILNSPCAGTSGDAGAEAGGGGSGMSAIPACAAALVFSP